MKKKICVITTSLADGGAERSSALLTEMLYDLDYEVHVLMTKNNIDYKFAGKLYNLEEKHGDKLSNLQKIKILNSYFNKYSFDVIIDNRVRATFIKEFILYNFIFKAKKKISVIRSFHLKYYLPDNKFIAKLIYGNNAVVVAVSKGIEKAVLKKYKFLKVSQIYNPVDMNAIIETNTSELTIDSDYILWYGRIVDNVKNLTLLIEAYKKSSLKKYGIKLCLIGEGEDLDYLNERILDLGLKDDVIHIPFLKNPFLYVKNAKFTVLTSHFEGFPRVLIESLSCGTPVVSVDCNSGPREIIINRYNGLLVDNYNVNALAQALNHLIEDKLLYNLCKSNAVKSIDKFSLKNIAAEWKKIIEQ